MRRIIIDGQEITQDGDAWVVAEIGHNHGGDLRTALKMCRVARNCGCDAVKFQKRTLWKCFTKKFLATPYNSEHAFGPTYGEHRAALEFGWSEYRELFDYCTELGITFFATAFDEEAADFLEELGVPCYKIASGDLINFPLIEHVAKKKRPIIISTGGASWEEIEGAASILSMSDAAFLHCVARYPTQAQCANMAVIEGLMNRMPDRIIGYSCHYNGILMAEMAYMFGARIIEKHFTLDHTSKGSDHALSLQPDGMRKLVRDLKRMREGYGSDLKDRNEEEDRNLSKMSKSVYPARTLEAGHVINQEDIVTRSPAISEALAPYRINSILGRSLVTQASTEGPLTDDMLEE